MKRSALILAVLGVAPLCFAGEPNVILPTLDALVARPGTDFYTYRGSKDLIEYLDSIKPEQIPAIMKQFDVGPQHPGNILVQSMLASVWADADPQAFLTWCAQKGGGASTLFVKRYSSDLGFSALAGRDPNAAVAEAQKLSGAGRQQALEAIGTRLAQKDPLAALVLLQKNGGQTAITGIFAKWAERDLDAATKQLLQMNDNNAQMVAENGMIGSLIAKDPHSAVIWIDPLPDGRLRDNARQVAANQWANADPQKALEWVRTFPSSAMKNSTLQMIVTVLGNTNPEAALKLLSSMTPLDVENAKQIVETWMRDDPSAAIKYVGSLPSDDYQAKLRRAVIEVTIQSDPALAASMAQALPDSSQKNELLRDVVGQWIQKDATSASTFIETLPEGALKNDARKEQVTLLASSNIKAALSALDKLQAGPDHDAAVENMAGFWSRYDPKAALAYGLALPAGDLRKKFVATAAQSLFGKSTDAGAEYVKSFPAGDDKTLIITSAAYNWARYDVESAAGYAASLSDGPAKDALAIAAVNLVLYPDPTRALSLAIKTGDFAALKQAISGLAANEPQAAVRYWETMPAGPDRQSLLTVIARNWAGSCRSGFDDFTPVANWVTGLPESTEKNEAIFEVGISWARTNPAEAYAWAEKFSAPEFRHDLVYYILREWTDKDPAKAFTAVEESSLSLEEKQGLIKNK